VYFSIDKYRGCGCRYGQLLNLNLDQMRPGTGWRGRVRARSPWPTSRCGRRGFPRMGTCFGRARGGRAGRVAHRVQRDEHEAARAELRSSPGRGGSRLPASRGRDCAERGGGLQGPGEPFVRHWVHGAFLLVEGPEDEQVARQFLHPARPAGKGYSGREIRYLLLTAHYRESFNFTLEGLAGRADRVGPPRRVPRQASRSPRSRCVSVGEAGCHVLKAVTEALDDDSQCLVGVGRDS
jgi:hypothetical protein